MILSNILVGSRMILLTNPAWCNQNSNIPVVNLAIIMNQNLFLIEFEIFVAWKDGDVLIEWWTVKL
jgi:hypothetical protein